MGKQPLLHIMNKTETLQRLLDLSVAHVRKQGVPSAFASYDSAGVPITQCRYLSDDGKKCAAGIFIKKYNRYMETRCWGGLTGPDAVVDRTADLDPDAAANYAFVERVLQGAHDRAAHMAIVEKEDFMTWFEREIDKNVRAWNCDHNTTLVVPA